MLISKTSRHAVRVQYNWDDDVIRSAQAYLFLGFDCPVRGHNVGVNPLALNFMCIGILFFIVAWSGPKSNMFPPPFVEHDQWIGEFVTKLLNRVSNPAYYWFRFAHIIIGPFLHVEFFGERYGRIVIISEMGTQLWNSSFNRPVVNYKKVLTNINVQL